MKRDLRSEALAIASDIIRLAIDKDASEYNEACPNEDLLNIIVVAYSRGYYNELERRVDKYEQLLIKCIYVLSRNTKD